MGALILAGRYRLERSIGEGGMGTVHEATDLETKKRVAVKVLELEGAKMRARFQQEARAMQKLSHPHVVAVSDYRVKEGEPAFLVMELLEGESLRARMKRAPKMPVEEAARIACELLDALAAAHALGIVHRDVKPPNVFLVGAEKRVKLLDFGIAKVKAEAGGVKTTTGTLIGTPSYFAPEQLLGGELDGRTDVHAACVVLYEMLTGERPWDEDNPVDLTAAILHAAPRPIEKLRDDVPSEIVGAVNDGLAKERLARPTAEELRVRLLPFVPGRRSQRGLFLVALGVAGAGIFGAAYGAQQMQDVPVVVSSSKPSPPPPPTAPTSVSDHPVEASPNVDYDREVVREQARRALLENDPERVRKLLEERVMTGAADEEEARFVREACKQMRAESCVRSVRELYPERVVNDD